MKMGIALIVSGGTMFILGLIMYYSIELGETDSFLRDIKNSGTFIGLSGIGVTLAGILLYLINRNEAPMEEQFDG